MDEGNGTYYMRARYYDAEVGRFMSKDPIGLLGGINAYSYAGSNPVNYIDPTGEGIALAGICAGVASVIDWAVVGNAIHEFQKVNRQVEQLITEIKQDMEECSLERRVDFLNNIRELSMLQAQLREDMARAKMGGAAAEIPIGAL